MANRPNLIGDVFGRLTVLAPAGKKGARRVWSCRCECGNEHIASTSDLRYGSVQSCGCLLKGETAANGRHGHSGRQGPTSPTYNSWRGMIDRCSNPSHSHFKHYGGRGIAVCERWHLFENFLADMGERPIGRSIDRIDVNGNYCRDNCRWATASEQARNKRTPNSHRMSNGSTWTDGGQREGAMQ